MCHCWSCAWAQVRAGRVMALLVEVYAVFAAETVAGGVTLAGWAGVAQLVCVWASTLPQVLHAGAIALPPFTFTSSVPAAVEAGVRGPSRQVAQAYLGFKMGVWSYNGAVKHWEPVVEPWDVIAQCAANHGSRVRVAFGGRG